MWKQPAVQQTPDDQKEKQFHLLRSKENSVSTNVDVIHACKWDESFNSSHSLVTITSQARLKYLLPSLH